MPALSALRPGPIVAHKSGHQRPRLKAASVDACNQPVVLSSGPWLWGFLGPARLDEIRAAGGERSFRTGQYGMNSINLIS
jgi:hypothetical protein